jgi:hypothetical protein
VPIAYICSTPYQLLVTINMKLTLHKFEDVDIFILNHFKKASERAKTIEGLNIFHKVKLVESQNFANTFATNKVFRYFRRLSNYLRYRNIVEKIFSLENSIYDEVYFSIPEAIIEIALKELYIRNPNIKIHLFEDGTGGYSTKIFKQGIFKKLLNKITGFEKVTNEYDSIMVFKPELFSGKTSIPIKKIPNLDPSNNDLKNLINTVFEFRDEYIIDQKIIFLEQPINHIVGLNSRIKDIADIILKSDYIVKLHPRSNSEEYENHKIYKANSIPWELLCLNSNIDKKIIISYFSTAAITNKILFDKEPIVIFLFELEELKSTYKIPPLFKEFVEKFKETYRDQSKVFIPENLLELTSFLSNLNN